MKKGPLLAALVALSALSAAAALPRPAYVAFDKGARFAVDGYAGSAPLSGFPVLVRIAENSPVGFFYTDLHSPTNGADIAFVDMDGAGLPFEIDTWDTNGTSLVWVRLPTMTNGTQFVMCWGSDASGKTVCNESPFSGYVGVWHMSEASGTVADSSGNGLAATPSGTAAATVSGAVAGKVGNGRECADAAYLSITNAPALDVGNAFAVSGWFDMSSGQPSGDVRFFSRKVRSQSANNGWEVIRKSVNIAARGATGDNIASYTPSPSFAGAGWKHVFVVYNDRTATIYEDGVQKASATAGAAPADNDNSFSIGSYSGGASSYFVGNVDECRLLGAVPSADWAKAEYDSMTDAAFLTNDLAKPYGASSAPVAGILVSTVGYTNATVVVALSDFGTEATSADGALEVSATADFAAPLLTETFSAAATGSRPFPVSGLSTNTAYFVRVFVTNDLQAATAVAPVSFTTLAPGAPAGSVSLSGRDASSISATATVASSGTESPSASVRLEASADAFATTVSSAWEDVPLNASRVLTVSGLAPSTIYDVRLRLRNEWGIETVSDLGRVVTLPSSGLTELYVDSLGNGSGTSPESALPTIRDAVDLAGPGFTIWVRGGVGRHYEIATAADNLSIPAELEGLSIRGWDGVPLISVADDYAWHAGGTPVLSNGAARVTLAGLRFEWTKNSLGQAISGQGTVGPSCNLVQNVAPFLTLANCEFALSGDLPDGSNAKSGMAEKKNLFYCNAFDATNLLVDGCTFLDCRADSRNKDFTLFVVRDNARFVGNVFSNVTTVLGGIQLEGNRCTGRCYFISNVVHQAGGGDHRGVFSAAFAGPKDRMEVTYNRFVNDDGPPRGSIFRKSREGFANGPVFHHNTVVGFREFIFAEGLGYVSIQLDAPIFDNIFVLATDATNIVENAPCPIQGYGPTSSWRPTMFKVGSFYRNNALRTGAFNGGTAAEVQRDDWSYDITAGLAIDDTFVLGGTTVPAGATIPAPMPEFADARTFSPDFYRPKASRQDGTFNYGKAGWTGDNGEYPEYLGSLPPLYPEATLLILK